MEKALTLTQHRFTDRLIGENDWDRNGFDSWFFCPGMLFNSPQKWWGDLGLRDFPHEGFDLCLYRDGQNHIRRLDENFRIPVMANGVVRAIFTDYLGQAVIIEHETLAAGTRKILSVYAHTTPRSHVHIGKVVHEGDIIASIADTSRSKSNILPHLHFSLGLPTPSLSYDDFEWNIMRDPNKIVLLNPLDVFEFPHRTMASDIDYCRNL
jgi:hypothetical protein